jgi:hypothetical protein
MGDGSRVEAEFAENRPGLSLQNLSTDTSLIKIYLAGKFLKN